MSKNTNLQHLLCWLFVLATIFFENQSIEAFPYPVMQRNVSSFYNNNTTYYGNGTMGNNSVYAGNGFGQMGIQSNPNWMANQHVAPVNYNMSRPTYSAPRNYSNQFQHVYLHNAPNRYNNSRNPGRQHRLF